MRIIVDDRNLPHKLKPQTAIVLGVIERCSYLGERKGWYGSYEALSDACPANVPRSTVGDVMQELVSLGLIVKRGKAFFAVRVSDVPVRSSDENSRQTDATVRDTDSPLNNPPIKGMKEDKNEVTHMQPHDANQTELLSFEFKDFRKKYLMQAIRHGIVTQEKACPWFDNNWRTSCENLWQPLKPYLRRAILEELDKEDGFWRNRPDWQISDYRMPQPHNLNQTYEYDDLVKTTRLVCAGYGGSFGVYTLVEAESYDMDIRYGMNFDYKKYKQEKEQNNG